MATPPTPPLLVERVVRCCNSCGCTGSCEAAVKEKSRMRNCSCKRVVFCSESCRKEFRGMHEKFCKPIAQSTYEKINVLRQEAEARGLSLFKVMLGIGMLNSALLHRTIPPIVVVSRNKPTMEAPGIENAIYCTFKHNPDKDLPANMLLVEYTVDQECIHCWYYTSHDLGNFVDIMMPCFMACRKELRSFELQRYMQRYKIHMLEYLIVTDIIHYISINDSGVVISSAASLEQFVPELELLPLPYRTSGLLVT